MRITALDWCEAVVINFAIVAGGLLVVGCVVKYQEYRDRARGYQWVGHKELEITFGVVDADSGRPIPHARVAIRAEKGGFCEDRDEKQFTLTTGDDGTVKHSCGLCMSMGTVREGVDTFAIHLPYWWYHASAPGYVASEPVYIDDLPHQRQVQRGGTVASLTVPIRLKRDSAR